MFTTVCSVDWGTVLNGTYTLITGTLNTANLDNFGLANAYTIGGGRSAYFEEGSLKLTVVPEPSATAFGLLAAGWSAPAPPPPPRLSGKQFP